MNQFIASELDTRDGFILRQETGFPAEQETTLSIKAANPQRRTIHMRVPVWADGGSVRTDGHEEAFAQPGSYLALTRAWRDGDKIEISLSMKLTTEPLPGDPTLRAALYGPLVLAADLGPGLANPRLRIGGYDTGPKQSDLGPPPEPAAPNGDAADFIDVVSARELAFKSKTKEALPVMPMYRIANQRYAVYWADESPSAAENRS